VLQALKSNEPALTTRCSASPLKPSDMPVLQVLKSNEQALIIHFFRLAEAEHEKGRAELDGHKLPWGLVEERVVDLQSRILRYQI